MRPQPPSKPTSADPSRELLTGAVLAVLRANGTLLAWGDRFAAPLGLTSARWQLLGAIALAGEPIAAPRIATAMGMSRQGAQKQVDLLVREGLVERLPNPAHARSPLYQLTPSGESVHRQIDHQWERRVSELAARLDGDDVAAARRFLARLVVELAHD